MARRDDEMRNDDELMDGQDPAAEEEEEEEQKSSGTNLSGLPSWAISTGFHILLLLLLSLVAVAYTKMEEPPSVFAALDAVKPPPEPLKETVAESNIPTNPNVPAQDVTVPTPILADERVEISDHVETPDMAETHDAKGEETNYTLFTEGGPGEGGNTSGEGGEGAGYGVFGVGGGGPPGGGSHGRGSGGGGTGAGIFGHRGLGGQKLAALKGGGGTFLGEAAVDRALAWLAKHQEGDGHWDCQKYEGMTKPRENVKTQMSFDVAVTGLAVLAFLGAGHTTTSPKYGKNVRDALYWLEEKQGANGKWPGSHYGQGIAALAMAEAYGMGCGHAECAQKAMDYLKFSQNANGGWNYGTGDAPPEEKGNLHGRHRSDTSVTGWQVMAAKSGKIAGLKVDPTIFTGAQKYFGMVGANEYEGGSEAQIFYSLTNGKQAVNGHEGGNAIKSITMLALLFMGDGGQGPWMQKAAGDLRATGVTLDNFYYVYYGSLAMFQIGGEHWKAWNEQMRDPMIKLQRVGGEVDGSWDPDTKHGPYGGRVYQTALGAMILEVYYRYLPVLAH